MRRQSLHLKSPTWGRLQQLSDMNSMTASAVSNGMNDAVVLHGFSEWRDACFELGECAPAGAPGDEERFASGISRPFAAIDWPPPWIRSKPCNKVPTICQPAQRNGLFAKMKPRKFEVHVNLHAGEWWQLPDIQMPCVLSKVTFHAGELPVIQIPPGSKGNFKDLRWSRSLEAQTPCKKGAIASLAHQLQGGVRKFVHPTHSHSWPLCKDEAHCNSQLSIFTCVHSVVMQNAWNLWGPMDQAKGSVPHLEVSQFAMFAQYSLAKVSYIRKYPTGLSCKNVCKKLSQRAPYRIAPQECVATVSQKLAYRSLPQKCFQKTFDKNLVQHVLPENFCSSGCLFETIYMALNQCGAKVCFSPNVCNSLTVIIKSCICCSVFVS